MHCEKHLYESTGENICMLGMAKRMYIVPPPALLNTVRISNTVTSNVRKNNKVAMAPELHPSFYVLFI